MPVKTKLSSRVLDEKDKKILMILQTNGREQLKSIANKVGLSIDSVHKRIKEMIKKKVFHPGIFIDPRVIGFPLVVDVKIKLRNITEEEKKKILTHLADHPRIVELLSIMGEFDLTCVIIAKDTEELDEISTQIRQNYSDMIADWRSALVLKTHKFEYYDLK